MNITGCRDTWVEVDLSAIAANLRVFSAHLPPQTKLLAVVKANGYGHGALPVAKKALENGAYGLAVAFLGEAVTLRDSGIEAPILVMGYTAPDYAEEAVKRNISVTVYQPEVMDALEQAAVRCGLPARVHIKLDTGMGRIGVRDGDGALWELIDRMVHSPWLEWEGMFTHYATADEEDPSLFSIQNERFHSILDQIKQRGYSLPPLVHASNSAAAAVFPEQSFSLIRLGISLYGLHPSSYTAKTMKLPLTEALSLKTRVSHVKILPADQPVSYGATYMTRAVERIATLPIGYGDGYSRRLSNKGQVLIRGKRAPIIGRVCMDQIMVNVTHLPEVSVGDEAVLIGRQGDEYIGADEVAGWLDTINYEVTCMIGSRVPRVYRDL